LLSHFQEESRDLFIEAVVEALGNENVFALTADSETYPSSQLKEAKVLAKQIAVSTR
jgi:uncharacterized protein